MPILMQITNTGKYIAGDVKRNLEQKPVGIPYSVFTYISIQPIFPLSLNINSVVKIDN